MTKRILHVTKEQYETLVSTGTVETGHIEWMEQKPVVLAKCPIGRSVSVTSRYPSASKCVLTLA
jgi:hypothetical protein